MTSSSCRAEQVRTLAHQLLAAVGLHDWSFGFNRSKLDLGLCRYGPRINLGAKPERLALEANMAEGEGCGMLHLGTANPSECVAGFVVTADPSGAALSGGTPDRQRPSSPTPVAACPVSS